MDQNTMEVKIFEVSELLENSEVSKKDLERLCSDSKLSVAELYDLVVGENVKYLVENVELFNFLYFYQFRSWESILDKFMDFLMEYRDYQFPDIDKIPRVFREYIEKNSCINKENPGGMVPGVTMVVNQKHSSKFRCFWCEDAMRREHLSCLKRVYVPEENGSRTNTVVDVERLISSGNMKIMNWLKSVGYKWHRFSFLYAIASGTLETMKWLHELAIPFAGNKLCTLKALHVGDNAKVEWLIKSGFPQDDEIFVLAIANRNFDVVRMLIESGFTPSEPAINEAREIVGENVLSDLMGNSTPE
jgi:hypothetical protein